MHIERARYAGACYGVNRALDLAFKAHEESCGKPVYTLGPLIHNPRTVAELERLGVHVLESLEDAEPGTLVIRSHGVAPEVIAEAQSRGLDIIDATCPHVKNVHQSAEQLASEGYFVIIFGEHGHPEVQGITGYAGSDALVVQDPAELPDVLPSKRIGIVVQTTQSAAALARLVERIEPAVDDFRLCNTICGATKHRQEAARDVAARVDTMIVIGGRNSGNTTRLAQICAEACPRTFHIEGSEEIDASMITGYTSVGITAGASTPEAQIESVIARLETLDA